MKLEEKIRKLKKDTEKKIANEKSYLEMKKVFLVLELAGLKTEPHYNLQTIENMGRSIPTFVHIET